MMSSGNKNNKPKKYFRVERLLLKISGISLDGNETRSYKMYSVLCLILFYYIYPFIVSVDLFNQNFDDAIDNWAYVMGGAMVLAVTTAIYPNRSRLGNLLNKLEKEPFTANVNRGGEVESKLIEGWLSFTNMQGLTFVLAVILSIGSQIIYSFIKRITSSDYHDWNMGFAKITIINITYSPNYEIAWLYQNICLSYIALNMCSTILIISGTLAFISVQFQVLQEYLKVMVRNSQRKLQKNSSDNSHITEILGSSVVTWKVLELSLKDAVKYHLSITEIAKEIEDIFSGAMLWIYFFTLALECLEVYRASLLPTYDIRTLRLLLEALTGSFHSLLLCYNGERMTEESEKVANAAFQTNFVGTDLRFQKGLILIIRRSYDATSIKAGKLIDTSLITFAWILRTSYSIYMVLKNTNTND